jgi:hypothetical protein
VAHHHWAWVNGFMPPRGNDQCEWDEWPPRYFWPGDAKALAKRAEQRVRFLPKPDKAGAGHIWSGYCNNHVAQSTTSEGGKMASYVESAHIQAVGKITFLILLSARIKPRVNKSTHSPNHFLANHFSCHFLYLDKHRESDL